jgi:hypothetical protein
VAETDPCYHSLEAYKQYIAPLLDDYWHVRAYQEQADKLTKWEKCCPGGKETVERLRFGKAIPADPKDLPLPPVFADFHEKVVCSSGSVDVRKSWFYHYNSDREQYWKKAYRESTQALYDCCVDQFTACLKGAGSPGGTTPTSVDSERCLQQFSPEYQQQAAAESSDTFPNQLADPIAPSGFAVITAWPHGAGSLDLGVLTAAAALVGFMCGRAGRRRRWARFGGGSSISHGRRGSGSPSWSRGVKTPRS